MVKQNLHMSSLTSEFPVSEANGQSTENIDIVTVFPFPDDRDFSYKRGLTYILIRFTARCDKIKLKSEFQLYLKLLLLF